MGPDVLWVAVFMLGGAAVGLITVLVGLRKGHDLLYWLALHAFMLVAVVVLDVEHPLWTVLAGSLAASLAAAVLQASLVERYRRKNPWAAKEMAKPRLLVWRGFLAFAVFAGGVLGLITGAIAWGLSSLF